MNTANKAVTFQRTSDYAFNNNVLSAPTVTMTTSDSAAANTQVKLVFDHGVDANTAIVEGNYRIEGATVLAAQVLEGALNTVVLTLKQGDTITSGPRYLDISGVKAKNSVATQPNLRTEVTLNENVTPKVSTVGFVTSNSIQVTFTEAVTGLDNSAFSVELSSGSPVAVSSVTQTGTNTALITLGSNLPANTAVKVKKGTTVANVKDSVGNLLEDSFVLDTLLLTN